MFQAGPPFSGGDVADRLAAPTFAEMVYRFACAEPAEPVVEVYGCGVLGNDIQLDAGCASVRMPPPHG